CRGAGRLVAAARGVDLGGARHGDGVRAVLVALVCRAGTTEIDDDRGDHQDRRHRRGDDDDDRADVPRDSARGNGDRATTPALRATGRAAGEGEGAGGGGGGEGGRSEAIRHLVAVDDLLVQRDRLAPQARLERGGALDHDLHARVVGALVVGEARGAVAGDAARRLRTTACLVERRAAVRVDVRDARDPSGDTAVEVALDVGKEAGRHGVEVVVHRRVVPGRQRGRVARRDTGTVREGEVLVPRHAR